jgi:hypothetical protein
VRLRPAIFFTGVKLVMASSYMPPWVLALIVLLVSCAVGAYYAGGKWSKGIVPEGFSSASYLRKQAQGKCDTDFYTCTGAGTDIGSCTTIYNKCTAAAAAAASASATTGTVSSAPSDTNQLGSAVAAIAAAKAGGKAGSLVSGDKTTSAEYQAELKAALSGSPIVRTDAYKAFLAAHPMLADRAKYQVEQAANSKSVSPANTDTYKAFLASLASRSVTDSSGGAPPTNNQLALAQGEGDGVGSTDTKGTYTPNQDIIAAHVTPAQLKALITAKLASDAGTQAEKINEDSILTPSVRAQIRNDVRKVIRDEIDAINNEYEIQYD